MNQVLKRKRQRKQAAAPEDVREAAPRAGKKKGRRGN